MRLLLVEDEPFIALDLQLLSISAGHEVVGVADCMESALALAASETPDAVLIDINLRDGFTGVRISQALTCGTRMRVGFVTGNAEQIPPDFAGALAVLDKPFTQAGLEEMLGILQNACEGNEPLSDAPPDTPAWPATTKARE